MDNSYNNDISEKENKINEQNNKFKRGESMKVGKRFLIGRFLLLIAAGGLLWPMQALPLPQNGSVVAGQAEINQAGSQMTITQESGKTIINWDSYSIDVDELVQYIQPDANAVSLNRVVGSDPTAILGQLIANGQVWIINPNGILFGKDATVNVAGLLATTLNISDSDFLNGNYEFNQDSNAALSYIINKGKIVINDNGYAILVAPLVSNEGLIVASLGKVRIGAAEKFVVNFDGSNLVNFAISNPPEGQEPGTVLIPADQITDIIKEVVNTPALVEAGQIVEENGVVSLVGAGGTAINTGTIKADGAAGSNAGSIEINSTQATAMVPGSFLSASGVGENSNGGEVKILSAGNVAFTPGVTVEAKGGTTGNGGFVEASAGGNIYLGADVNTLAENGQAGTYIIDPTTLYVADGSRPGGDTYTGGTYGGFLDTPATDTIYETELENATSNIVLQATQNIIVQDISDNTINISGAGITLDMATIGTGSITFNDTNDTIQTNGGYINISNPNGSVTLGNLTTGGGAVTVLSSASSVGNIDTSSTTGNGGAVTLTFTGTGTVTLGSINSSSSNAGSAGGDISITGSDVDMTVTGTINSSPGAGGTAGNVSIVADQLDLQNSVTTGGGSVTLALGGTTNSFKSITTSGGAISITGGVNYTFGGAVNSGGGQIVISSNDGAIAINENITSGGGDTTITGGESVVMAAGKSINTGAGALTITADTGAITLYDLTTNNKDITITSNGGTITLNGNIATSGGGLIITGGDTISQDSGTTINTGAGDITFSADNDITIANATTTGTAAITSANGSILEDSDPSVDLTAGVIVLSAGDNTAAGTSNINNFDTSSTDITATADNNVDLTNTSAGDATVTLTSRISGNISFTQTGGGSVTLTAQTANGNIDAQNSIGIASIDATSVIAGGTGDIWISAGTINAGDIQALGNTVELNSYNGGVFELAPSDGGADIQCDDLLIRTTGGVGTSGNYLDIDALNLALTDSSSAGVYIRDTSGGLTIANLTGPNYSINGVTTSGGQIDITTLSPLIVNAPINAGAAPINLTASNSDGYIEVNSSITNTGANDITLTANGVNGSDQSIIMDATNGSISAGQNATLTANSANSGDIIVSSITAGGNISITADNTGGTNGNILDDSDDTTALQAGAGGTLTLLADEDIGANSGAGTIPAGYLDIDMTNSPTLSITANTGDVWLNFINGALNSSNLSGGLTVSGGINLGVTGNDFTFDDGTFDGITNDLSVIANNIILSYDAGNDIDTTGNVSLTATSGYIQDTSATDNNTDIIANDLQMTAQTGIESGGTNPNSFIETDVSSLTAANNTSGDIYIDNYSSALQINGLTNNASHGEIRVYNYKSVGGTITVAGNVTSQFGYISLIADSGMTINNGVNITSNNGPISLTSDSAGGGGAFIQNTGSTIDAGAGNVYIYLSGASTLNDVRGDDIRILFTDNASVSDNGTTSVTATNFEIHGSGAWNLLAGGINLNTAVSNLQIGNFGGSTGNITISNSGALTLADWDGLGWGYAVNNPGGNVNISTASPLNVNADVTASGDITLTAAGGDTGTINVDADVISSGGNVSLIADNDINITLTSGTTNTIDAGGATPTIAMTANNDSGSPSTTGAINQTGGTIGSGDDALVLSAAEGITLGDSSTPATPELSVASVQASNSDANNIYIYNTGTLAITGTGVVNNAGGGIVYVRSLGGNLNVNGNVSSNNGHIYLRADDNITQATGTTISSSIADIYVEADYNSTNSGGITQNGTATIVSNGGTIYLFAGSPGVSGLNIAITSVDAGSGYVLIGTGNGAVVDNDVVDDNDITAQWLGIESVYGIGSGNPLETQVSNAEFTNWASNNIEIINTGDLDLVNFWNSFGWAVANNVFTPGSGSVNITAHSDINILDPIVTYGGNLSLTADEDIIQWSPGSGSTPYGGVIYTGSTEPLFFGQSADGIPAGSYTATADSDGNGTGAYTMQTGTFIDTTDVDGLDNSVSISAGDDITVTDIFSGSSTISLTAQDPVNLDANIVDDANDSTMLSASGISLTADLDIGGTDGQAGIRPEFLDIDASLLGPGSIVLTGGGPGSDIYLNFLNGDFHSSYIVYPNGVSTNNAGSSIDSLTIGVSGGNNLTIDSNIFNVDDGGNPTGIYYDLNLLSTGNLTITNPIVTNATQITLGTAGSLILSTANITFNNPDGTLILWADFDDNGTGSISTTSRVSLNNVSNLILIAAQGINIDTQGTYNVAAYNDTSGGIRIDNIGDITVFDGTGYVGVPGIDVNGINNPAGGDVYIYAHSNVNINAPINTFGGNLDIIATENITHSVTGDITTSGGYYHAIFNSDLTKTGAYTMADNGADASVIDVTGGTGNGTVLIEAPWGEGQDITVSQILADTTNGEIRLITFNGAIQETALETGGYDFSANKLIMVANTGIGSSDMFETNVNQFGAMNGASGDIQIDNTAPGASGLTIVAEGPVLGVHNNGGNIYIEEDSPINVLNSIWANGNITLIANDSAGLDDGDIINTGNGTITSAGGNVNLYAGHDIDMGANISAANTLNMLADDSTIASNNSTGTGSIIQTAGRATGPTMNLSGVAIGSSGSPLAIDAGNLTAHAGSGNTAGDIYLSELNNITLTDVDTYNGVINVTAAGSIVATDVQTGNNNNITLTTTSGGNITAGIVNAGSGNVTLNANGIILDAAGDVTGNVLTADANGSITLTTDVNSMDVSANAAGDIDITENDAVTLTDVDTTDGDIDITAGGTITATDVQAGGSGDIFLTATGGASNISVGTVTAAGDDVTLDAGSNITGAGTVTASQLYLSAGGNAILNTNVDNIDDKSLTENVSGALTINETGAVILGATNGLSTDNGTITITAGNTITATNVVAGGAGDMTLTATAGNILLGLTDAAGDRVTLSAVSGNIVDNNGGSNNVVADELVMTAANGIGSGDALETQTSNLQATNSTSNNIEIDNTGALTLADITGLGYAISNPNGQVIITAHSPLNVNASVVAGGDINLTAGDNDGAANDDITIATNVNITSTGGDVTLQAGDDITQAAGTGVISAGGGDIYLYAGHDNDGDGLINIAGKAGSGAENLVMEADQTINANTNVSTLTATTDNADITITEDNGLALNLVNAGSGDVNITVNAGNLTDNNGASNNISGNDVVLNVVSGDIGTGADSIETDIDTLAITNAGNAYINEANGIILNNINVTTLFDLDTSSNGSVTSNAGTKITATSVDINADGAVDINTNITDITVATTNDNVVVNEDNGLAVNTINAGTGDVTLTLAAGAITDNNAGANNITANLLDVTAPGGVDLDTDINTLTANTSGGNGNINIYETNGLDINNVNAGTGDVTLTLAAGALNSNPGTKITADEVTLTAPAGIDVNTNINTLTATTTNSDIIVVEDNTLALNNINAGTGDIEIELLAGTLTSNAGTSITGNDLEIIGDGAVNINTDVNTIAVSTNNADITVAEANGLGLNLINAGTGDVNIGLAAGAITDNNADQKNIIADDVTLAAVDGIGSGNALETTMNTLTAANTNNGIEILDEGGLTIVAPGINNTNGWVNITTLSPLNVNASVVAGGDINLTAGDNDGAANDDITIATNVNITSTGGDVTLQAGDDITQAAGTGVISAGGGDISLYAGHDNDGDGLINMQAVVGSGAETLAMEANQGITVADAELTTVNAFNSGTGDITITANTTTARTLTIDDVTLGTGFGVKANNGNVVITNNGTIDIPGTNIPVWPSGAGVYAGGNVSLTANGAGSDILLASSGTGTVITGIYAGGTVDLTANDDITAGSVGGANNGNTADILAGSNITLTATNGDIIIGGDNNAAYTGVISATGRVVLNAGSNININSNYATGTVIQANNTGLNLPNYAVSLTAGGNINFVALNTSIDAGSAPIHLVAGSSITDNNTNIDIIGGDLVAEAGGGIGSGNALETQVSRLAARVTTGNGNIQIENTGDLVLDDLIGWGYSVNNAGTGNIDITVNSNLVVDDPVISNGGNVNLTANSGAISQNINGDITTNGGNYTAYALGPYWMADGAFVNAGSGNIDIDAGGDITIGQLIGTNVFLNSGGAILDGGDTGGEDIQATAAELVASTGIGNGDAIETLLADLAAVSTTGPININETNNLTVAPVGTTTGITTTGDIDLDVGGDLTLATNNDINSNGGAITIDAGNVVQNNGADILSPGVPTDGDITLNIASLTQNPDSKIDAGSANVDINATGNVALDEINGNIVDIRTTGGYIEEQAPDSEDDITAYDLIMIATTGIGNLDTLETQVSRLNAYNSTSGNIDIYNTGDLTIDNFAHITPLFYGVYNGGGSVYIEVGSSIDIPGTNGNGVYATGDVELTADENITAGSSGDGIVAVQSILGSISLDAGNDIYLGQVYYSDVYADGDIDLTAGNDITVDAYTYVQSTYGDVTLNATRNINLITREPNDATDVSAYAGSVHMTAGNDINVTGIAGTLTLVYGYDEVNLNAGNDINSNYGDIESNNSTLTATATGNVSITNSYLYSYAGTYITGTNVLIDPSEIESDNEIEITATNGDLIVVASDIYSNGAYDVTLTANSGSITSDTSEITSEGGTVGLTADNDVNINDSAVATNGAGAINITANTGDVNIDPSTITAQNGDITITASAGDVNILDNTIVQTTGIGSITITGNQNVNITDSAVDSGNAIDIEAGTNVDITNGDLDAVNAIGITANTGYVTIDPSTLTAGTDITILAATDVDIIQSQLTAGDDISITATSGDITICGSTLTAGDDTGMTAGRDIIICADSTSTSGDDATLSAGRDIELGYVEAGDTATLTAGGEIRDNNDDNVNIVAPILVMSAVNGIGVADGIETQTGNLTATNTTAGDIWIRNNTTVAGDLTISGITNSAPGGMVRVENGLIRFENGAVSEIDRTTGGNMTLAGVVQADGSVKLYTIGSILDGNTATPYDVIATDTSDMLAFAGDGVINPNNNPTIGVFDGNPDGSGYDPIEVNINPGDLYVFAEGENFFISVGIDGIVQPRDVLLCYPHLVPPGLIFFNGRMNGGMRSNQWFRAVSTSIHYIGAEDTVYSEILLQLIKDKYFQPADANWEMDEELEQSLDIVMR